eukprot:2174602-Amphidinium_carterae.1
MSEGDVCCDRLSVFGNSLCLQAEQANDHACCMLKVVRLMPLQLQWLTSSQGSTCCAVQVTCAAPCLPFASLVHTSMPESARRGELEVVALASGRKVPRLMAMPSEAAAALQRCDAMIDAATLGSGA